MKINGRCDGGDPPPTAEAGEIQSINAYSLKGGRTVALALLPTGDFKKFFLAKKLFVDASGMQRWVEKLEHPESRIAIDPSPSFALFECLILKKQLSQIYHSFTTLFRA